MNNEKIIMALKEELAKLRSKRDALIKEYDKLDLETIHYSKEVLFPMENDIGDLTDAQCNEIYEHWDKLVKELDAVRYFLDEIETQIAELKHFSQWYIDELTEE